MTYLSSSSVQTKAFGAKVAAALVARGPHKSRATIVALAGDLGAGKTTFTQGYLRALGIKSRITSPTFVLMKNYKIGSTQKILEKVSFPRRRESRPSNEWVNLDPRLRGDDIKNELPKSSDIKNKSYSHVFHTDWYRLSDKKELDALGFKEILSNPKNIILIEWPERIPSALPMGTLRIRFRHGHKENFRTISLPRGISL